MPWKYDFCVSNYHIRPFLIPLFPADQDPQPLAVCDDWCMSSSSCITGGSDCLYCGWNFGCKKITEESEDDNKNARRTTLTKIKNMMEEDEDNLNGAYLYLLGELETVIDSIH